MVIEVIVDDSSISSLTASLQESIVTVDDNRLRMVQSDNGKWYGYFADRTQAQEADSLVGLGGHGLDFGEMCSNNSSITGLSLVETSGFTIPRDISSSSNGLESLVTCTGDVLSSDSFINNVVREYPTLNTQSNSTGQVGIDTDVWPLVQLFDLTSDSNISVDYEKSSGTQSVVLTFANTDEFSTMTLDDVFYRPGEDIKIDISDVWLNIDPTDEDSWTFGTLDSNPSTHYQVFDENGVSVGDIPENTDNLLTSTLDGLMCEDNCIFLVDSNVQGAPLPVLTLQDNEDTQIIGTDANDATSFQTSGGHLDGDIPVTLVELGPNVGVFGTYDEGDVSVLKTTSDAARGTSGTVDYNETPTTVLVGFHFATIDIQLLDDEWSSGEEIPVVLVDSDLNKNSRADEDLDLFDPNAELIPSLTIGNPFTLNSLNPLNGAQLSSSSLTVDDVQRFSERAMLTSTSDISFQNGDTLVLALDDTFADLYKSINEPNTTFRGFNHIHFDLRSIANNLEILCFFINWMIMIN